MNLFGIQCAREKLDLMIGEIPCWIQSDVNELWSSLDGSLIGYCKSFPINSIFIDFRWFENF